METIIIEADRWIFLFFNSQFIYLQKVCPLAAVTSRAHYSTENTDLRDVMAQKVPIVQEDVKAFRQKYGKTKVGEITVDMVRTGRIYPMKDMFLNFLFLIYLVVTGY